MKLMTRLAVLFYMTIVLLVVIFSFSFVLQLISLDTVIAVLEFTYTDIQMRMVFGATALVLLLISMMFARIMYEGYQMKKTIAFDNPSGRVSVSLTAMEDLVRRLMEKEREVKDVKTNIQASKKGLEITVRLILRSNNSIPNLTSKLQDIIKKKIQNTIGLDEAVNIRIHVVKIIPEESVFSKSKEESGEDSEETPANVPFHGYRP